MTMIIEVESAELHTLNKKGGGTYQMQEGYAHTVDNFSGQPRRHPERIMFFPPRRDGNVVPVPPGKHLLSPKSFRVNNGRLELGFLDFTPVKGS